MTLPFLGPCVSSFVFVYTFGFPFSLSHAEPLEAHTETRCRSALARSLSPSDPFASMSPTAGSPFLQSALPSVIKPEGCAPNASNPSTASKNPEVSTQHTTPRWTSSAIARVCYLGPLGFTLWFAREEFLKLSADALLIEAFPLLSRKFALTRTVPGSGLILGGGGGAAVPGSVLIGGTMVQDCTRLHPDALGSGLHVSRSLNFEG
jgi:hypothetical protein